MKLLIGCCVQDLIPPLKAIGKSRSKTRLMGLIKQD